MNMKD